MKLQIVLNHVWGLHSHTFLAPHSDNNVATTSALRITLSRESEMKPQIVFNHVWGLYPDTSLAPRRDHIVALRLRRFSYDDLRTARHVIWEMTPERKTKEAV